MTEIQIVKIIGVILLFLAAVEILHLLALLISRFSTTRLLFFILVLGLNLLAGYGIWIMTFRTSWPSLLPFVYLLISTVIYIINIRTKKK
jgi:hypothetical protein